MHIPNAAGLTQSGLAASAGADSAPKRLRCDTKVSRIMYREAATFPLGTHSSRGGGLRNRATTSWHSVHNYTGRDDDGDHQQRRPSMIYCGVKVGEALNPGHGPQTTSIRLQNVRGGGRHKGDLLAGHAHDVLLITEYELVEYAVKDARMTFRDRGKTLLLGASASITKKYDKIRGRRVAASIAPA